MSSDKVISVKNLPARLPILTTAVSMIAMDYYGYPLWFKGSMWTLLALIWVASIVLLIKQNQVDIFKGEK